MHQSVPLPVSSLGVVPLLLLLSCGGTEQAIQSPGDSLSQADASVATPFACSAPLAQSKCGNPASIVQGRLRLPAGSEEAPGTLVIAMLHRRYGNPELGGHPHYIWRLDDARVDEGYAYFEVDMCDGRATMWSEENCEYNLVAFFDANGNNGMDGSGTWIPDPGEAAVLQTFELSCFAEGATCLDLEPSCSEGQSCLADAPPSSCECKAASCESQAAICRL